jgi:DNA-binding LytR/AlgR family response regulator
MNRDFKTPVNRDAPLETLAAELALAAYRVHTAAEEFPTYYPLATLARWLGGSPFLQIARDAIVNMTVVTEITRVGDRRYELRLRDRARTVAESSRTGAALLADYLRSGRPG